MEKQLFKLPKNIRQCGMPDPELHIYMEDYVKNYIEETDTRSHDEIKLFILIGEYMNNDKKQLFISGAIELKENKDFILDEEKWRYVYNKIRNYFPDKETVGWVMSGSITGQMIDNELFAAHMQNFGLGPKVLYIYNWLEKREVFFTAEVNKLRMCLGYNIYYSKNEEMQNYMLECGNEEKICEELSSETETIKELSVIKRQHAKGKKETADKLKKQSSEKSEKREGPYTSIKKLSYTAAFFLMLVACAVSLILLRGESKGEKLQKAENGDSIDKQKEVGNINESELEYVDVYASEEKKGMIPDNIDVQASKEKKETNVFERKITDGEVPNEEKEIDKADVIKGGQGENDNLETTKDVDIIEADKGNSQEILDSEEGDKESDKTDHKGTSEIQPGEDKKEMEKNNLADSVLKEEKDQTVKEDKAISTGDKESKEIESTLSGVKEYTVTAGDTLAGIARKHYGDLSYITKIKNLNNLNDENMIKIGQKILLP